MIYVAVGGNLPSTYGSPMETCEAAVKQLEAAGLTVSAKSSWYETEPVPKSMQPSFINNVVQIETDLDSTALLKLLLKIEKQMGRQRSFKNAPRVIDLDMIAYNDEINGSDFLTLPHPRMQDRAFVLYPLAEIAPDWHHPVLKKTAVELKDALSDNYWIKKL